MSEHALVIGLTATRSSGKDTLFSLLNRLDDRHARFAFADSLKAELAPFILAQFGIDVWSCTPEEKEIVRPLLIGHGMARRNQDPLYWVKKTVAGIEEDMKAIGRTYPRILIPVVTDVRFVNEATHLRETFPGFRLINIVRQGAPPPTEEEEKHYRKVADMADYWLNWGGDDEEAQTRHATAVLEWLRSQ